MVSISHFFQWPTNNELPWLPKLDLSNAQGWEWPLLSWLLWSPKGPGELPEALPGACAFLVPRLFSSLLLCALSLGPRNSELRLQTGLVQGTRRLCYETKVLVNFGGLAQDINHDLWNYFYGKTISKFQEIPGCQIYFLRTLFQTNLKADVLPF